MLVSQERKKCEIKKVSIHVCMPVCVCKGGGGGGERGVLFIVDVTHGFQFHVCRKQFVD